MNDSIQFMLAKYRCQSSRDYINALHEIFQEIALLGLWRAKFYEHAAFYGGTALRILYGLNRFSEDLDFSLLREDKNFDLAPYNQAVKMEMNAFGFEVEVATVAKAKTSAIQSAFIKGNTRQQLVQIEVPAQLVKQLPQDAIIKIKMEIDTEPPEGFQTEAKYLLNPLPCSVHTYTLPCLFAGKLHAILCRQWQTRVKGRDWYDLVWFMSRQVQPNIEHLRLRLLQTGHLQASQPWNRPVLKSLLLDRVDKVDFEAAKEDVSRFIKDDSVLEVWSKAFFAQLIENYF